MPTEIEGPHGITIDAEGKHWYLSMAHGSPNGYLVKYSQQITMNLYQELS